MTVGQSVSLRLRKSMTKRVTWLAIFAVVLHVMLLGLAPIAAAGSASFDPFSVICHSGGDVSAPADQTSDRPGHASQACEHCNLCSATGTPSAPDVVIAGRLLPERLIAQLSPASVERRDSVTSNPKLSQGPPQQA